MPKPTVILAPHWRGLTELFRAEDLRAVHGMCDVVWGQDAPIPDDVLARAMPQAEVLIAETPRVTAQTLAQAPHLKMVIEVSGAFPDTIDYAACAARGVEVLSCAPGFRQSVAEMGLAMALSTARGLVAEHEAFRTGGEAWLADREDRDFTLFGARVGFVGFGQIAQELTRLLAPFGVRISAYDPWLPAAVAQDYGIALAALADVLEGSQVLFVAAVPTSENRHMIDAQALARIPRGAVLILLSRAHLVDFDALGDAVTRGHIRAAVDVFPSEPLAADDALRQAHGVILSPHRAAAVPGGRQLIGEMIRDDIRAMIAGDPMRRLAVASLAVIDKLAGATDGQDVAQMAQARDPATPGGDTT
ncbi:NAD(P)-dependent oxidoreductase [uncultured Tateyamaria sp.]|uniref:NAD(P)-dependent oxidoreductase n=1 Tax=uncultured Tateyamaria sp. TaxID=455651 RepID=UPI00260EFBD8|nr:NAD(P)-dependent oxidoreductase [uncultured Tateyamaria sp.]